MATTNLGACECSDPGCPACKGKCGSPATMILHRSDMEDESGVAFCDGCGSDALESGVFGSRDDDNVDPEGDPRADTPAENTEDSE